MEEAQALLSPPAGGTLEDRKVSSRKRKREQEDSEVEHSSSRIQEQPPLKRLQTSPSSYFNTARSHQTPEGDDSKGSIDPLRHWIQTGKWRREYFEQDSQVREDFEKGKLPEDLDEKYRSQGSCNRKKFRKFPTFAHLHQFLTRKKPSSLRRQKPQSAFETLNDQLRREKKSSQYNSVEYEIRLEQKGSYMHQYNLGITDTSQNLCQTLLKKEQTIPQNMLFRYNLFEEIRESIQGRNEAMIVRDISSLICPSAQF